MISPTRFAFRASVFAFSSGDPQPLGEWVPKFVDLDHNKIAKIRAVFAGDDAVIEELGDDAPARTVRMLY